MERVEYFDPNSPKFRFCCNRCHINKLSIGVLSLEIGLLLINILFESLYLVNQQSLSLSVDSNSTGIFEPHNLIENSIVLLILVYLCFQLPCILTFVIGIFAILKSRSRLLKPALVFQVLWTIFVFILITASANIDRHFLVFVVSCANIVPCLVAFGALWRCLQFISAFEAFEAAVRIKTNRNCVAVRNRNLKHLQMITKEMYDLSVATCLNTESKEYIELMVNSPCSSHCNRILSESIFLFSTMSS